MSRAVQISLVSLAVLVGAGFVIARLVAPPISTDLSGVGQGTPALVLAYENFSPAGGTALERIGRVRADYEDRMMFRVADLGTPDGKAFARRHGLSDAVAVFLTGDGRALRVADVPASEQELRQQLDLKLAHAGAVE